MEDKKFNYQSQVIGTITKVTHNTLSLVKTVKKEIPHYEMQENYFMYRQLQVS